ncbi:ABC transporter, ATP-binding protein [Streptomyces griseoflavus Tu4000]|uniref:ABC transporter, ATP-binding protein n=1 Tax=Streptomyces griseoflavus Tu4000 TaxID=467200 RepID=D9XME7_9ACTN|nr:ABC transporter, ATP-binding protein [Streptomyces griseoflavus Tu4000]
MSQLDGDAVALRRVSRRYGSGGSAVTALDDVSLAFPHGSFTAVMGPSGSGKSTLLQCAAGLDRPTSGSVTVDGTELTGLGERRLTLLRRERIGFVFQAFNLLPALTAEQNVALPLRLAGRRVPRALVREALRRVGLGDRARHRPARTHRRPAAAGRAGPCPGHPSRRAVRRRADRGAGLPDRPRGARPAARHGRPGGTDGRHGDPRPGGRRPRRPGGLPGGRPRPRRADRGGSSTSLFFV